MLVERFVLTEIKIVIIIIITTLQSVRDVTRPCCKCSDGRRISPSQGWHIAASKDSNFFIVGHISKNVLMWLETMLTHCSMAGGHGQAAWSSPAICPTAVC